MIYKDTSCFIGSILKQLFAVIGNVAVNSDLIESSIKILMSSVPFSWNGSQEYLLIIGCILFLNFFEYRQKDTQ